MRSEHTVSEVTSEGKRIMSEFEKNITCAYLNQYPMFAPKGGFTFKCAEIGINSAVTVSDKMVSRLSSDFKDLCEMFFCRVNMIKEEN